jgi:hypothetical protein
MQMSSSANPYDELPYKSLPIEWTVLELLALASLLHGDRRSPLYMYRVLELGSVDGANLLPRASIGVRSCIATLPKKGQQCVVRQIAGATLGMETMVKTMMIKILKSHNRV